mmetsp:Transcript_85083/g.246056  ORF Transcript_85083/g.246056 Transcript_85083/m.246056 type:complete len:313 (+) Transcript_85083:1258-2196(+)
MSKAVTGAACEPPDSNVHSSVSDDGGPWGTTANESPTSSLAVSPAARTAAMPIMPILPSEKPSKTCELSASPEPTTSMARMDAEDVGGAAAQSEPRSQKAWAAASGVGSSRSMLCRRAQTDNEASPPPAAKPPGKQRRHRGAERVAPLVAKQPSMRRSSRGVSLARAKTTSTSPSTVQAMSMPSAGSTHQAWSAKVVGMSWSPAGSRNGTSSPGPSSEAWAVSEESSGLLVAGSVHNCNRLSPEADTRWSSNGDMASLSMGAANTQRPMTSFALQSRTANTRSGGEEATTKYVASKSGDNAKHDNSPILPRS